MLFYLPLNQNVYQGLLQETKVWFQIQHLCLVTCLFGARYTRTDFPISALNGRIQWELQASPMDLLPLSRHAYWQSHPVPLQRSPIQLDVKDTNKSWANEERSGKKDAGQVNPAPLKAIWEGGAPHSLVTAAKSLERRALGNNEHALLCQHQGLSPCCPPHPRPAAGFQPEEALQRMETDASFTVISGDRANGMS